VVVWKLDRWARSLREGVNVLAEWCQRDVRVVAITQQIDLSGTVGHLIASLLLGMAEIEHQHIKERQAAGIAVAKEHDLGCTCAEWAANIAQIRALLGVGIAHNRDYAGTPFHFCLWCGQPLTAEASQRDETLVESYRQRIEDAFFAGDEWGMPQTPNMRG
jgi:hypothetical protein